MQSLEARGCKPRIATAWGIAPGEVKIGFAGCRPARKIVTTSNLITLLAYRRNQTIAQSGDVLVQQLYDATHRYPD